jgi:hypothetical protein
MATVIRITCMMKGFRSWKKTKRWCHFGIAKQINHNLCNSNRYMNRVRPLAACLHQMVAALHAMMYVETNGCFKATICFHRLWDPIVAPRPHWQLGACTHAPVAWHCSYSILIPVHSDEGRLQAVYLACTRYNFTVAVILICDRQLTRVQVSASGYEVPS